MKQILFLNPENVSEDEIKNYPLREAARAVVFDKDGMVALLYVSKENYYKLPGGGLEDSEDKFRALQRECLEEIGCDVEVTKELGSILEYRKIFNIKQVSYCYLAKVKGEKGVPQFTESESGRGFELVWLPLELAKRTVSESKAVSVEGSAYIVPRDTALLEAVSSLVQS